MGMTRGDQGSGAAYAVSLSVCNIFEAIVIDERRVLPASYNWRIQGVEDVYLSVPRIVGHTRMEARLPIPMKVDEEVGLRGHAPNPCRRARTRKFAG